MEKWHTARGRGAMMLVGKQDPAMDNSQRARLLLRELWRERLEFARLQLEAAKPRVEAARSFSRKLRPLMSSVERSKQRDGR